MPSFTVVSASEKRRLPDKKKVVYLMQIEGDAVAAIEQVPDAVKTSKKLAGVEWYTDETTPMPAAGASIEGEVKKGDYGFNFWPPKRGGGGRAGGGGRPRDPKDDQRIVRQHAQKCAVELIKVAHDLGLVQAQAGETPLERVGQLATMVETVAEHLEGHVYRGMETPIAIKIPNWSGQ